MRRSIAFSAVALAGLAAAPPASRFDVETVRIADNVYGFFETKVNPIVSGNIIAVVGSEAVLLFDTGHHPPVTRGVVAEIRRLTDKPVRYVVVSHWHDDHWVGNAQIAEAWPDVQVIAHPFTARLMEERREKFRGDSCKAELSGDAQRLSLEAASGKRADGSVIPEESLVRVKDFLEAVNQQIGMCDEMRYRGVDRQVADSLDLSVGGRTVRLLHPGRGNTAGDLVAWLPESRILLTGDLVVHPFPYATQSYIGEWARVLHRLEALNPAIIVPGHGPVLHDTGYLDNLILTFESVDRQARAAYQPGMTADQLRARIDIAPLTETFSHGDRFIRVNFEYMIGQAAIDRVWQELSGKWEPEG